MSEEEKNRQIGEATTEYQTAKVEAGHLTHRIDKVFRAYREIGDTMDRDKGTISEPRLVDGSIAFGYTRSKVSASDLLNESELRSLLAERDAARERLAEARRVMESLGITAIS